MLSFSAMAATGIANARMNKTNRIRAQRSIQARVRDIIGQVRLLPPELHAAEIVELSRISADDLELVLTRSG